jgi:hypothetical protein
VATPLSSDIIRTTGGFASPSFDGFAVFTSRLCAEWIREAITETQLNALRLSRNQN